MSIRHHGHLLSFHKLGENRGSPRLWLESRRLETLGFSAGTGFIVEACGRGVRLRASGEGKHHVAQRRAAGGVRPIIDVVNRTLLAPLVQWEEVKVAASVGLIDATPSVRAFTIRRQRSSRAPWRTLEVFSGGGTLSAAIGNHSDFHLVAGVEIEPRYADVWQAAHRDALLIQADVRLIHPSEYPAHEVLVAAIPCTSHSPLGRAKKSLRQKPELGDTGDLFLCIAALVATHLPLACVFENVPSFGSSLAGQTLAHHLGQLGYYITQTILDPHKEWDEPQDRRRWLMVATLGSGFTIQAPNKPFRLRVTFPRFWTRRAGATASKQSESPAVSPPFAVIVSAIALSGMDSVLRRSTRTPRAFRQSFDRITRLTSAPSSKPRLVPASCANTKSKN